MQKIQASEGRNKLDWLEKREESNAQKDEEGKGQITWNLLSFGEEFEFYSEW